MLESYLAYGLIPLFLIILFALVYFVLIRPQVAAQKEQAHTAPKPKASTSTKPDADDPADEKMI